MKLILSIVVAYFLVGIIRTARSWKGHRAEVVAAIARNPRMVDGYFVPWAEWLFHVAFWPGWLPEYKVWRRKGLLINETTLDTTGRGATSD